MRARADHAPSADAQPRLDRPSRPPIEDDPLSERWRAVLTDGHQPLLRARRVFRHLPSPPRCKVCSNPFGGIGGRGLAIAGFRPSRKNPTICGRCCDALPPGGAEVDIAVLFADVRGSTSLGEHTRPREFAALLNRFYAAATETLLRHDAVIDKLIGDEVMAFFVKGISGPDYRNRAVLAGVELLRAVGYGTPQGPWIRLAAAVNAGLAYVGNVGNTVIDFTALGDPVNTASRMQALASAGELLIAKGVTDEIPTPVHERTLSIPGRDRAVEAFRLELSSRAATART